jgi:hypothetical protein
MNYIADYNKWGDSAAKFIFSQAESELKQLIELGRIITDRAYKLLAISSGIFFAIIGYVIHRYREWSCVNNINALDVASVLVSLVLLFALIAILKIIFPGIVYQIGRSPSDFLSNDKILIPPGAGEAQIYGGILMAEIKDYQLRIEDNIKINNKRIKRLKASIWLLVSIFPIALLVILVEGLCR